MPTSPDMRPLPARKGSFRSWYAAYRTAMALLMLAGLLFGLSNCANSNLICVSADCQPGNSDLDNKVEIKGTYCTAEPNSVALNYRILFIVDVSGSTAQSDPTGQRGPAVQAAIQQYANNPQVEFAIISFSTTPTALVPTFTNNQATLDAVIPQLDQENGSTDYLDTLTLAQTLISNDANQMTTTQRARTVYNIQWLSDGVPNPCSQIASIASVEKGLLNLVSTYNLLGITFSTTYLTGAQGADACGTDANNTPTGVMTNMANEGGGTFQALDDSNLKFNIDLTKIIEPFSTHLFYLVNQSRVEKSNVLYADSDQDGVSDADEKANGTNPLSADTNNTGCNDGVNATTALAPNPGYCAQQCSTALASLGGDPNKLPDNDADGIPDCSELALASDHLKADTDGDSLIDSLEVRFNTDYGDPSTTSIDSDGDGAKDGDEVVQGTNPHTPEADRSLAYVYAPVTTVASSTPGTTCYSFDITNVQLVQTQATATSAEGDNVLCLYAEQLPQGSSAASSQATVTRTCMTANYKVVSGEPVVSPSGGNFSVTSSQFTPTICNSASCSN